MLVDANVHLLPDRLAAAIRRFFVERLPGYGRYPHEHVAARAAIAAAGVTRCWSLPYAHKPGMARDLNRWMAETFADDPLVVAGAALHPGDDVTANVADALDGLGLRVVKLHCSVGRFAADDARRWPEARIVIAHCAAPATAAALALLRSSRAVCADLTPVGPRLAPVSRDDLAGLEDRILFGSDAPNTGVDIEEGWRTCAGSASTSRRSVPCSEATRSVCSRAERISV